MEFLYTSIMFQSKKHGPGLPPLEDMFATYIVNIVQDRAHLPKVRPSRLPAGSSDHVTWINRLEEPVEVVFYRGDLVFEDFPGVALQYKFVLDPGDYRSYIVKNTAALREYSYQVYCQTSGQYAEGESDPKMILL